MLPSTLWFALANSQKGIKSGLLFTFFEHFFGILVKIHIWRIGFKQSIGILQINSAYRKIFSPMFLSMVELLEENKKKFMHRISANSFRGQNFLIINRFHHWIVSAPWIISVPWIISAVTIFLKSNSAKDKSVVRLIERRS